jgi:hypothetical protein
MEVSSTPALIGGQTLAKLGFVLSSTCYLQYQMDITGVQQRLEFVVGTNNLFAGGSHVTFYSNINNPSFSDFELFCLTKEQALCRYDTLCSASAVFFGDPACNDNSITGQQSTYIVTDSGEGCPDNSIDGAAVRWSTNDATNYPVCNKGSQKTCPTLSLTSTTVLACCSLTSNGYNTWSKVNASGNNDGTAACGGGESRRVAYCRLFVVSFLSWSHTRGCPTHWSISAGIGIGIGIGMVAK